MSKYILILSKCNRLQKFCSTGSKFTTAWILFSGILLLGGCGGGEISISTSTDQTYLADTHSADFSPPKIVVTALDVVEKTDVHGLYSVYLFIAADEALGARSDGLPTSTFNLIGHTSDGSSGLVKFVDDSKNAVALKLKVRASSEYKMNFSIPDAEDNKTTGSIKFSLLSAGPEAPLKITSLTISTNTTPLDSVNISWSNYGYTSYQSYAAGTYGATSAAGTNSKPFFYPPLVMERTRGPNYTWINTYRYQYACPIGYYCPPVEQVAPPMPQTAAPALTGVAGALVKICWELDCGGIIGDEVIGGIRKGIIDDIVKSLK